MISRRIYVDHRQLQVTTLLCAAREVKRSPADESIYRYRPHWRFHCATASQVHELVVQVTVTALISALLATQRQHETCTSSSSIVCTCDNLETDHHLSHSFSAPSYLAMQRQRHHHTQVCSGEPSHVTARRTGDDECKLI